MDSKVLNKQKHTTHSWVGKLEIKVILYASQQNSNTGTVQVNEKGFRHLEKTHTHHN